MPTDSSFHRMAEKKKKIPGQVGGDKPNGKINRRLRERNIKDGSNPSSATML